MVDVIGDLDDDLRRLFDSLDGGLHVLKRLHHYVESHAERDKSLRPLEFRRRSRGSAQDRAGQRAFHCLRFPNGRLVTAHVYSDSFRARDGPEARTLAVWWDNLPGRSTSALGPTTETAVWPPNMSASMATLRCMEPLRVDEENSLAWTVVAHTARVDDRVMSLIADPQTGSNLARVDDLYPFEKVSDRVRAYLRAGVEHMLVWADLAAPLTLHDGQVMNVTLRPAYTLARATIEASAQAVWLLNTRDPIECARRHLSLIRWDLQEHRKSKVDPSEKDTIRAREDDLLRRVSQVFQPDDITPPRSYLDVIKSACDAKGLELTAAAAERLWRAASGAAHGKYWPTLELQHIQVGDEYEPGHYRTVQLPNASAMTEVLQAANTMSQYGVVLFAQYSGVDVRAVLAEAMAWVAQRVPLRPGTTRADVLNLQHSLPWPVDGNGTSS